MKDSYYTFDIFNEVLKDRKVPVAAKIISLHLTSYGNLYVYVYMALCMNFAVRLVSSGLSLEYIFPSSFLLINNLI